MSVLKKSMIRTPSKQYLLTLSFTASNSIRFLHIFHGNLRSVHLLERMYSRSFGRVIIEIVELWILTIFRIAVQVFLPTVCSEHELKTNIFRNFKTELLVLVMLPRDQVFQFFLDLWLVLFSSLIWPQKIYFSNNKGFDDTVF